MPRGLTSERPTDQHEHSEKPLKLKKTNKKGNAQFAPKLLLCIPKALPCGRACGVRAVCVWCACGVRVVRVWSAGAGGVWCDV